MGISVGSEDDEELIGVINTTPLVDVMLVLLIIFLITIPVVTHTINVKLPEEKTDPYVNTPANIQLAVNQKGEIFWNVQFVKDKQTLLAKLQAEAKKKPQPEVHIRGDQHTHFAAIDTVISTTKQSGIAKIAFVTTVPVHP
nr:biopolymer transporter ExbD [Acinetobacter sp. Marseille-Q1620]